MNAKGKIILIEDDEDNAENILRILKQDISPNIVHFEDGRAALDYLFSEEGRSVKLILLDLILPSVDGIEILKKIKEDPDRKQIPVIVLVSSAQAKSYVDSLGLQPEAYANKPGKNEMSANA